MTMLALTYVKPQDLAAVDKIVGARIREFENQPHAPYPHPFPDRLKMSDPMPTGRAFAPRDTFAKLTRIKPDTVHKKRWGVKA